MAEKKATKKQDKKPAKKQEAIKEEEIPVLNQIKHEFLPTMETMSEEEGEQILRDYGIKKQHLPKISVNDPAVKKTGILRGDIIKIMRKSPTAGNTIYYRVVV